MVGGLLEEDGAHVRRARRERDVGHAPLEPHGPRRGVELDAREDRPQPARVGPLYTSYAAEPLRGSTTGGRLPL